MVKPTLLAAIAIQYIVNPPSSLLPRAILPVPSQPIYHWESQLVANQSSSFKQKVRLPFFV